MNRLSQFVNCRFQADWLDWIKIRHVCVVSLPGHAAGGRADWKESKSSSIKITAVVVIPVMSSILIILAADGNVLLPLASRTTRYHASQVSFVRGVWYFRSFGLGGREGPCPGLVLLKLVVLPAIV